MKTLFQLFAGAALAATLVMSSQFAKADDSAAALSAAASSENFIGIVIGIGAGRPGYRPVPPPPRPYPNYPAPRPYPPQQGEVCFYSDAYFSGASLCRVVGEQEQNLAYNGFNDRISSIRVFGYARVTVYSDANFSGAALTITGDIPNLGDRRFEGAYWNDRISSFYIER